jgi:hypothetical protein
LEIGCIVVAALALGAGFLWGRAAKTPPPSGPKGGGGVDAGAGDERGGVVRGPGDLPPAM